MLDEALDLVDAARADGLEVRLIGGLAVLALCGDPDACRRDHRDLDVVAPRQQAKRLLATFARLGYAENRHVRLASSGALMQVYRECAHTGPRGRLHPDDRVDVYLDAFRLHHTIALRRRLGKEPYTVPPSDVLLAKLLRTRMSESDFLDAAVLLGHVDVREDEAQGVIGLSYLAGLGARDWGLFHDVTRNLERVTGETHTYGMSAVAGRRACAAAGRILEAMKAARKGPRWRLRAALGERIPWYDAVDENDAVRIGLLERPPRRAGSAPDAGRA
jgi:hypothetical protein